MAKKKKTTRKVEAKAVAKAEIVANAVYQRKHSVTEIIPQDVTRARAGAWLDIISPITEWAGLKGDQLRAKRALFRVQQEETLLLLGEAIRKLNRGRETKPVAAKVLIPAIEKASLEDPSDDVMIHQWAELLSSASQKVPVQPRFVGILGELAGSQARCFEALAFNNCATRQFPARDLSDVAFDFSERNYFRIFENDLSQLLDQQKDVDEIIDVLAAQLNRPGVLIELVMVHLPETDEWYSYDSVQETGERLESDLAILESLGLVRRISVENGVELTNPKGVSAWIVVNYHHLTQLGVEFCEVCCRGRVAELEKIDAANRAKVAGKGEAS